MAHEIIEKLRAAVNAKHANAMRMIDALAVYLDEPTAPNGQELPAKRQPPRKGTGKIRNKVLAVFSRDYVSVQDAATQTGYSTAQVRGVLTASALRDNFVKRDVEGVRQYKFQGEKEAQGD